MLETGKKLKLRDEMFEQKMKSTISERLNNPDWDYKISTKVILHEKYGKRKKLLGWVFGIASMAAIVFFSIITFNVRQNLSETSSNNLILSPESQIAGKNTIIPETPKQTQTDIENNDVSNFSNSTEIIEDIVYLAVNKATPEEHFLINEFNEINGFFPDEFGVDDLIDNVLDKRFTEEIYK